MSTQRVFRFHTREGWVFIDSEPIDDQCNRIANCEYKSPLNKVYCVEISGSKTDATDEKIRVIFEMICHYIDTKEHEDGKRNSDTEFSNCSTYLVGMLTSFHKMKIKTFWYVKK